MKENGTTTNEKASVTKDSATTISTRVNIKMERFTAKASTSGPVARCLMDNGCKARNMDMVSGKVLSLTLSSASGLTTSPMDLESIFGAMEMFTKESGNIVSDTVKDVIILLSETHTLENISGAKLKDMANIHGVMEIYTRDNSLMDRKTVKANGRRMVMKTLMNTWVGIKTTRNTDMVSLNGPPEVDTKATT